MTRQFFCCFRHSILCRLPSQEMCMAYQNITFYMQLAYHLYCCIQKYVRLEKP